MRVLLVLCLITCFISSKVFSLEFELNGFDIDYQDFNGSILYEDIKLNYQDIEGQLFNKDFTLSYQDNYVELDSDILNLRYQLTGLFLDFFQGLETIRLESSDLAVKEKIKATIPLFNVVHGPINIRGENLLLECQSLDLSSSLIPLPDIVNQIINTCLNDFYFEAGLLNPGPLNSLGNFNQVGDVDNLDSIQSEWDSKKLLQDWYANSFTNNNKMMSGINLRGLKVAINEGEVEAEVAIRMLFRFRLRIYGDLEVNLEENQITLSNIRVYQRRLRITRLALRIMKMMNIPFVQISPRSRQVVINLE